ncbi:MAG: SH3 domain-containing protein [Snowella sp.]|nr:SH3 domain-containing protein [Snowella sp.]
MKRFSGVLQFTLGFFLGLLIFVGGVSLVGYLVFSRLAATPPRPVFPEENKTVVKPKPTVKPTTTATKDAQTQTGETTKTEETPKTEEVKASPSPEPSATPSPEDKKEELPAGAYQAKVIWSGGLSLRANPDKTSERVGGVDYNDALVVLEKSSDGEWVKVKVPDSDQVGWVRVGNIKKTE